MSIWVIATSNDCGDLVAAAVELNQRVSIAYVGENPTLVADDRAAEVLHFPLAEGPAEGRANDVATALQAKGVTGLLAHSAPADLVIAGVVAAHNQLPAYTDVSALQETDGIYRITTLAHSGIAIFEWETARFLAVFPENEAVVVPRVGAPVVEMSGAPTMQLLSHAAVAAEDRDIAFAPAVVGVGRGFAKKEDLEQARQLAELLDAEVGCSRPLAEGTHWFDHGAYIGVSGKKIKPDLYFAIGISGQLSHTVGIREAQKIVAINLDSQSPIFAECDFGVVTDLYDFLPALVGELRRRK